MSVRNLHLVVTATGEPLACAVREARARMTDAEWEADVFGTAQGPEPDPEDDEPLEEVPFSSGTPCTECGATAACGYDFEGRPMIHLQARED